MKIAILADTHLSAAKYSKVDRKTHLSRFMIRQLESLQWIRDYLTGQDINTIFHAGDVFDASIIGAYPLLKAKELFDGFNVYAIKGNHDDSSILHAQEISLLDVIGIHAISSPLNKVIENTNYVFIPWGYDIDTSLLKKNKKNVLITHGFVRPEFYHEKDAKGLLNKKDMEKFDLVIAGHNHSSEHFKDKNTEYLVPGSISNYANHFADEPYLWILDNDTLAFDKVPIKNGIRKYKVQTEMPNTYLETIEEEAIYQLNVPITATIEKEALQKAKKKALDIQINYVAADIMETEINEKYNFWDYVSENSEYLNRFREICEVECL